MLDALGARPDDAYSALEPPLRNALTASPLRAEG
jgi:hypothetical protein